MYDDGKGIYVITKQQNTNTYFGRHSLPFFYHCKFFVKCLVKLWKVWYNSLVNFYFNSGNF